MKEDLSTSIESYSDSSLYIKIDDVVTNPIKTHPKWENTESGQKLFIPKSGPTRLVASTRIMNGYMSTNNIVAEGEYILDYFPQSNVLTTVEISELYALCAGASKYCEESIEKTIRSLYLFYVVFIVLFALLMIIATYAIALDSTWVCIVLFMVFLCLLGPSHHKVNVCARNTQDVLMKFLEKDVLGISKKGVVIKAGPYGVYIEFSL